MHPPSRVHLPSGRIVALKAKEGSLPSARRPNEPLFSELASRVASGALVLREGAQVADLGSFELRDFHSLRAIATRLGWIVEEPIEIDCRNCGETIRHAPCSALELGPYVDDELRDPELDRTLDLSVPHPIPGVRLPDGTLAREVELVSVTVARAAPLHRALRRRRWPLRGAVVAAMGIVSLGVERDPARVATSLACSSERAWGAIRDLFLRAHYPPRLCSAAICTRCGARNEVDAPYDREFEPGEPRGADDAGEPRRGSERPGGASPSNAQPFPPFDVFDDRARGAFEAIAEGEAGVALIVDEGVPACDDGGEPLLGSYVPPGGDPSAPLGVGEITVYYRSFRATWDEEGSYDWARELETTIEHELEHHRGWQTGHDPVDDEERAEIVHEHLRRVGHRASARSSLATLGTDLRDFIAHTWPIWLIVAAASVAISLCEN
jgi:hypothetical protein